ncbi:group II intron maturase-specific domain-containing protein, partial [Actinomadura sp. BRA 177]|uniref:group II intron maturase-specific domain-containing protein n=1 Tax=Actinomadura sp. BRA 177 TaxID=2745202 RepID=UPI0017BF8586
IKKLTGRSTTSLSLAEVLRTVNPVLRGWAASFRYGAPTRPFAYLLWYAWWQLTPGRPPQTPAPDPPPEPPPPPRGRPGRRSSGSR